MAEEAKAKGNAAFSAGDYAAAVGHFTEAIGLAPTNHVLYSNRSAAQASLQNYAEALADAKKTVELQPMWAKGYGRLAAAHLGLGNRDLAVANYKKGLDIDPDNAALKSGLADAESSPPARPANPLFGDAFSGPEMWAKLTADPSTRGYLQMPDFVQTMKEIQKNPSNLNLYLKDQRVMQALGVLLNFKFGPPPPEDDKPEVSSRAAAEPEPEVAAPEPEPMEEEEDEEEKLRKEKKAEALKEKEAGNAAYKKKDFETAISHYSAAIDLDDQDISFLMNRAATFLEMGKVINQTALCLVISLSLSL